MVDEREAEEKGERQMPHRKLTSEGPSGSGGGRLVGRGIGCVGFLGFLDEREEDEVVGRVEADEVKVVGAMLTGGARGGGAGEVKTRIMFSRCPRSDPDSDSLAEVDDC
jgi:hypothetical protein